MNSMDLNQHFRREMNMRDLGGYRTKDGRTVKYGQFYRSAAIGSMNAGELQAVSELGLKYIFDFRSDAEAAYQPDPEIEGCRYVQKSALSTTPWSDMKEDVSPEGLEQLFAKMIREHPQRAVHAMDAVYAGLMHDNAVFREMFDVIRESGTPVLFHCSAGKDRTGTAAILILMMLGVSEEDAMKDYLLTNEYRSSLVDKDLARFSGLLLEHPECAGFVTGFNGVSPVSAQVVFDEIRNCGGIEKYMYDEFGIDEAGIAMLRDLYLE
ncbi:MAG: tyrosine-protein phosphatase [Solobacterium sp.]|nr:tyrosine-protein phosphatase [Solobacterium sp.]